MVTGVPTSPCTNPYGDYFLGVSLRNKQDYARLHGYELHLMAESVDSTIRAGPWQKIALLSQVRPWRRARARACPARLGGPRCGQRCPAPSGARTRRQRARAAGAGGHPGGARRLDPLGGHGPAGRQHEFHLPHRQVRGQGHDPARRHGVHQEGRRAAGCAGGRAAGPLPAPRWLQASTAAPRAQA